MDESVVQMMVYAEKGVEHMKVERTDRRSLDREGSK